MHARFQSNADGDVTAAMKYEALQFSAIALTAAALE